MSLLKMLNTWLGYFFGNLLGFPCYLVLAMKFGYQPALMGGSLFSAARILGFGLTGVGT